MKRKLCTNKRRLQSKMTAFDTITRRTNWPAIMQALRIQQQDNCNTGLLTDVPDSQPNLLTIRTLSKLPVPIKRPTRSLPGSGRSLTGGLT